MVSDFGRRWVVDGVGNVDENGCHFASSLSGFRAGRLAGIMVECPILSPPELPCLAICERGSSAWSSTHDGLIQARLCDHGLWPEGPGSGVVLGEGFVVVRVEGFDHLTELSDLVGGQSAGIPDEICDRGRAWAESGQGVG